MTAELHDQAPPDAADFIVAWLQPLIRAATEKTPEDGYPFALCTQLPGGQHDPKTGQATAVVQVEILAEGDAAANSWSRKVDRRMDLMALELRDVVMPDGTIASPDWVETLIHPARLRFGDEQVVNYTGRYKVATAFVAL